MPTKTPTPSDWLLSSEVCELLHIDRSTLSRWVAQGRITPTFKASGLRGHFYFTRDEVARVASAQERAS